MNEAIVRYVRENRGKYTDEAIRQALLAAGHPVWEIEEVLVEPDLARVPVDVNQIRLLATLFILAGFLGTFLFFVAFARWQETGFLARSGLFGILGASLLVGGVIAFIIALLSAGAARGRGLVAGLAITLLVPFLILVGIAGLCVATTQPFTAFTSPPIQATLVPVDGSYGEVLPRLTEEGTIGLIQVEDGQRLVLGGGTRLSVWFAPTVPSDATTDQATLSIAFRPRGSLEDLAGDPSALRVGVGYGDPDHPVIADPDVPGFGGLGFYQALIPLVDGFTTGAGIANLKVIVEAVDPNMDFEIDFVSLYVTYHPR